MWDSAFSVTTVNLGKSVNFSGSQFRVPSGDNSLSLSIYHINPERLVHHTNLPKLFSSSHYLFWKENNEKVLFLIFTQFNSLTFFASLENTYQLLSCHSPSFNRVFLFLFPWTVHELGTDQTDITIVASQYEIEEAGLGKNDLMASPLWEFTAAMS